MRKLLLLMALLPSMLLQAQRIDAPYSKRPNRNTAKPMPTERTYYIGTDEGVWDSGTQKMTNYQMSSVYLKGLASNSKGVYALVWNATPPLGSYYVECLNNASVAQSYQRTADGMWYSSMAMKVVDDHLIVAGVKTRTKGNSSKKFESSMFGSVDGVQKYETSWVSKDHTSERCVYHVMDCDYYEGYIHTTGWVDREYSNGTIKKTYNTRPCARVWRDGKEMVQQYQNRTCHAYSIRTYRAKTGSLMYLTAGDMRGIAIQWTNNMDTYRVENFKCVSKQVCIPLQFKEGYERYSIVDGRVMYERWEHVRDIPDSEEVIDITLGSGARKDSPFVLTIDRQAGLVKVYWIARDNNGATMMYSTPLSNFPSEPKKLTVWEK